MDELKRKIAAIRFRLKLFRAIDWALWALIGALTALCLTFLILNLFSNSVDRVIVASSLVGGALVVAIIAGLSRRLTLFEAALQVDSRLKLRERISSAVLLREVHQDDTEAYRALEEDAKRYAAAIRISKDFPYKFPRHGWHTAWPAIGLIALYFMPQFDLLGMANGPAAKKTEQPTLTAEERKKKAEPLQELAKKARAQEAEEIAAAKDDLKLADKLERLAEDVSKGAKNEKEALAEMSRMNDDAKLKQREMNAQMQPFKQIKGLQDANQTREMQKDLKDQDFKAAAEKMQQLAQQMMNPEQMSAEDKKELAQEMENLAQQLKDNPQMADAMQKAAEAIKQAADQQSQAQGQQKEDSSGATPQNQQGGQKEQKQTADGGQQQSQQQQQAKQQNGGQSSKSDAASQQKAQQAAQAAQAALQQAAQQMQNMQDMQQQMQQLSEMQKQMAQTMASSMAGSSQSQSGSQGANPQSGQQGSQPGQQPGGQQPGQGQGQSSSGQGQGNMNGPGNFQKGMSDQQGQNGPGGLGRGSGFRPDSGAAAQGFVDTFIPGQKNEGQIIAVFDVDAPAPKGESNLRYTSVPAAYQQRAADALTDTEIPVGMRNSVKDYFERINFGKQGDGAPPQQSAPAPPQPAKTQ